jgi:hypothetical protein
MVKVREELRIAGEVRGEQIDAPTMKRHRWRVGRLEAMLDVHLQDSVLRRRLAAVRTEQVLHRIVVNPRRPDDAGAKRQESSGPFNAQRVGRAGERQLLERGAAGQIVDHMQRADLALQGGPSGC